MDIFQLETVMRFFRGGELTDDDKNTLFQETLFMTLARATAADTNIASLEVKTVQAIMKREAGVDVEAKDVRIEAIQHAFETAPFNKLLAKVRQKLDKPERVRIADALAEVISVDNRVGPFEIDFFNAVVKDLGLEPSDIKLPPHGS